MPLLYAHQRIIKQQNLRTSLSIYPAIVTHFDGFLDLTDFGTYWQKDISDVLSKRDAI
jgi:hypothetical protein